MKSQSRIQYSTLIIVLFFCVLILALLAGGHFYFQKEKSETRENQYSFLSAISAFKVNEIRKWMEERTAEGVYIASNPHFLSLFRKVSRETPDRKVQSEMEHWLLPLKKSHKYMAIWVCDTNGRVIISLCDEVKPVQILTAERRGSYLHTGKISFTDLETDPPTKRSFIDMVVPLAENNKKTGFVVFRLDPELFLFPLIRNWPVERVSASNILARQQGDSLIYLHGDAVSGIAGSWQHKSGEPDGISKHIPAVGTMTMVEAKDHRGVNVLADIRKIQGTAWSLVTKIDMVEVDASLKSRAVKIVIYLLTFLAVVVITMILLWKNQQLNNFRKQLELQSKTNKAEERIRFMNALLEGVNDAIITFDKDMMIQSWNKGAERIYGWKSEEVVGKFGGGSLRVDFPGTARESVYRELEKTGAWKGEVMHKRKDGTTAYLLSSTSNLRDDDGNILGIITINKDISEVIQSEKVKNTVYRISELAHASRDLDDLYMSIHVVIGELMDARNLYIALVEPDTSKISFPYFVNEKEQQPPARQKGFGLAEYVLKTGKPLLAKPDDYQYYIDRGIIDMDENPAIDWLGVPLRIDKETIGVLVIQSYSPKIRYGDREKDILIFVSEQIALSIYRKKMQQELVEAKQKAEVANKLTSSLLANMNHELRTPMNGILGFAEILVNDLRDEDTRGKAENILVSGRRLMDTLDAIMDLSYLESDTVSRKFKPIMVGTTVRAVLRHYEQAIKRKKLILSVKIPDELAILGDEHLFKHLIKNLTDNAVKYTEHGSITITAARVPHDEKSMVSISVKDTGIGISKEHYRMIFEAFRQVSEGYGRQFEGSGLGLTISKRIVDLMHGEISLSSSVDEGSEFQVLLVSAPVPKTGKALSRADILAPKIHSPEGKKLPDVLIVEDNLVNVQLLMIYIHKYCNIYTCLDAKAAIDLTRERKFDAILMDINLGPGMDGIQGMLEIRKRPDYYNIPILAVTGYASIGDRERLMTIGFNGYIPKPYDKVTIAATMSELFPGQPGNL